MLLAGVQRMDLGRGERLTAVELSRGALLANSMIMICRVR